jgi:TPR repeat protein
MADKATPVDVDALIRAIPLNVRKAPDPLLAKANAGEAEAQRDLGFFYSDRFADGVQDCNEGVYWYTKAAEQGNTDAQYSLGLIYYVGQCVAQDYEHAFSWFSKAAEQGYAPAQSSLGRMYVEGYAVTQNYKQAVFWYTKSAKQGENNAQSALAYMYEKGRGVDQSNKTAYVWWSILATSEHPYGIPSDANNERDRVAAKLTPAALEEAQAEAAELMKKIEQNKTGNK